MRKLKHHEKKILKKVDFVNWGHNLKEVAITRRYGMTRHEYTEYNKLCHEIRTLASDIIKMKDDAYRVQATGILTEKLYKFGLIKTKRIKKCLSLSVKAFCRRRLPVFMIQSGMFDGPLQTATKYVQHGHVKIGPRVVKDPATLVTLEQQDYITWNDKLKKKIEAYRGELDDYED